MVRLRDLASMFFGYLLIVSLLWLAFEQVFWLLPWTRSAVVVDAFLAPAASLLVAAVLYGTRTLRCYPPRRP